MNVDNDDIDGDNDDDDVHEYMEDTVAGDTEEIKILDTEENIGAAVPIYSTRLCPLYPDPVTGWRRHP